MDRDSSVFSAQRSDSLADRTTRFLLALAIEEDAQSADPHRDADKWVPQVFLLLVHDLSMFDVSTSEPVVQGHHDSLSVIRQDDRKVFRRLDESVYFNLDTEDAFVDNEA